MRVGRDTASKEESKKRQGQWRVEAMFLAPLRFKMQHFVQKNYSAIQSIIPQPNTLERK